MGDAKRRALLGEPVGAIGPYGGDAEILAMTQRAVAVLSPVIFELAQSDGEWGGVLNALETLLINLQIEMTGVAETERVLRALIKHLPEFARAQQLAGKAAGSA